MEERTDKLLPHGLLPLPRCVRRVKGTVSMASDEELTEAFYSQRGGTTESVLFLLYFLAGMLSPFSAVGLFVYYLVLHRGGLNRCYEDWAAEVLSSDMFLYSAVAYASLALYWSDRRGDEVAIAELVVPFLFMAGRLLFIAWRRSAESDEAVVIEIYSLGEVATTMVENLQLMVGQSAEVDDIVRIFDSALTEDHSEIKHGTAAMVRAVWDELDHIYFSERVSIGQTLRFLESGLARFLSFPPCEACVPDHVFMWFSVFRHVVEDLKLEVAEYRSLMSKTQRCLRLRPTDRESFRCWERLKWSACGLQVEPQSAQWPRQPREWDSASWLEEFVAQSGSETGIVQAHIVARQIISGLAFRPSAFEQIGLWLYRLSVFLQFLLVLLLGVLLPNLFRQGRLGSFTWPSSAASWCIFVAWVFMSVVAGGFCLVICPWQVARFYRQQALAEEALTRMLTPARAAEWCLPFVSTHRLQQVLAWKEIRSTVHMFKRNTKASYIVVVDAMCISIAPLLGFLLYRSRSTPWNSDLLFVACLYVVVVFLLTMPQVLVAGVQVNTAIAEQTDLLVKELRNVVMLGGYVANPLLLDGLGLASLPEQAKLTSLVRGEELQLVERQLQSLLMELQLDAFNTVRLVGLKLTVGRAVAAATAVSASVFMFMQHIGWKLMLPSTA